MKNVGVLAIILTLLFLMSTANATTWYVHPDSALNSIQAALDFCANDDTVLVGPGIYYENIIWPYTQGIDLVSEYGPDTTVINGGGIGSVIRVSTVTDSTTVIKEFTIQNGSASDHGAGIRCSDSTSPLITGNTITSNSASRGGGIYCYAYSNPIINNNIIIDNSASIRGGGISCFVYSNPTITNNTITYNSASLEGGGISCHINSNPIINDNTINDNSAEDGGGIFCDNSDPIITNNTITNNSASFGGGGIHCYFYSDPAINNNTIMSNSANSYGGGIYCSGSDPTIANNIVSNNFAYKGGGIICDMCNPTITDNTINNNSASFGGGIYCWRYSPTITHNTIAENSADGLGDGIYCTDSSSPVIDSNNIYNNGYAVYNTDSLLLLMAENNWWGDSTGPYHPVTNPGGLGDSVSDYVDFDPWLIYSVGVEEQPIVKRVQKQAKLGATIFRGPLQLPEGKKCKVFDIAGRIVEPAEIQPGIYFVEIDGAVIQKIVKVK